MNNLHIQIIIFWLMVDEKYVNLYIVPNFRIWKLSTEDELLAVLAAAL
jgi:hypothetical protein